MWKDYNKNVERLDYDKLITELS